MDWAHGALPSAPPASSPASKRARRGGVARASSSGACAVCFQWASTCFDRARRDSGGADEDPDSDEERGGGQRLASPPPEVDSNASIDTGGRSEGHSTSSGPGAEPGGPAASAAGSSSPSFAETPLLRRRPAAPHLDDSPEVPSARAWPPHPSRRASQPSAAVRTGARQSASALTDALLSFDDSPREGSVGGNGRGVRDDAFGRWGPTGSFDEMERGGDGGASVGTVGDMRLDAGEAGRSEVGSGWDAGEPGRARTNTGWRAGEPDRAGTNAGPGAGWDAGPSAGPGAGWDAGPSAGPGAGWDAGPSAGPGAGWDADRGAAPPGVAPVSFPVAASRGAPAGRPISAGIEDAHAPSLREWVSEVSMQDAEALSQQSAGSRVSPQRGGAVEGESRRLSLRWSEGDDRRPVETGGGFEERRGSVGVSGGFEERRGSVGTVGVRADVPSPGDAESLRFASPSARRSASPTSSLRPPPFRTPAAVSLVLSPPESPDGRTPGGAAPLGDAFSLPGDGRASNRGPLSSPVRRASLLEGRGGSVEAWASDRAIQPRFYETAGAEGIEEDA